MARKQSGKRYKKAKVVEEKEVKYLYYDARTGDLYYLRGKSKRRQYVRSAIWSRGPLLFERSSRKRCSSWNPRRRVLTT